MSRISGFTAFDAGFQKYHYDKVTPEYKRADKKPVEKYGEAQKTASKQPYLSRGTKELLSEMQKKYGDMDFFVAGYSSGESQD